VIKSCSQGSTSFWADKPDRFHILSVLANVGLPLQEELLSIVGSTEVLGESA
jgi:hypothetical protein